MEKIVILGGGGHARVIADIIRKIGGFELIGYTDLHPKEDFVQTKYLGTDADLIKHFKNDETQLALGIGGVKPSLLRYELLETFIKMGYKFPPIVSPDAVYNSGFMPGEASVIFDGVVVNSGVKIGKAVIVNTNATIEHDCLLGNNVHIAPGATVCGEVNIGDNTTIGAGSIIIQNKNISSNVMIGAGSLVLHDIIEKGTYFGIPAKRAAR